MSVLSLKLIAIKLALQKPSPARIPLSLPKCSSNDFFTVHLERPDKDWNFFCEKVSDSELKGYVWTGNQDVKQKSLQKSEINIKGTIIKITHYYKGTILEYDSAISFFWARVTQRHKLIYRKENIAQIIFNSKKLLRADRIQVLEYILGKTKEDHKYSVSALSLATELYSKRWFRHPERSEIQNQYNLILESLVSTGDLHKENQAYKLKPKALDTISEYELNQQRHFDNQNNEKKTRVLTGAIIILGLLNLGFEAIKWAYEAKLIP